MKDIRRELRTQNDEDGEIKNEQITKRRQKHDG